eukprot:jgi/Botrbrau1/10875/Bobra.0025s0052.1
MDLERSGGDGTLSREGSCPLYRAPSLSRAPSLRSDLAAAIARQGSGQLSKQSSGALSKQGSGGLTRQSSLSMSRQPSLSLTPQGSMGLTRQGSLSMTRQGSLSKQASGLLEQMEAKLIRLEATHQAELAKPMPDKATLEAINEYKQTTEARVAGLRKSLQTEVASADGASLLIHVFVSHDSVTEK